MWQVWRRDRLDWEVYLLNLDLLLTKLEEVEEFVFILCKEVNRNISRVKKLLSWWEKVLNITSTIHGLVRFNLLNSPQLCLKQGWLSEVLGKVETKGNFHGSQRSPRKSQHTLFNSCCTTQPKQQHRNQVLTNSFLRTSKAELKSSKDFLWASSFDFISSAISLHRKGLASGLSSWEE